MPAVKISVNRESSEDRLTAHEYYDAGLYVAHTHSGGLAEKRIVYK